MVTYFITDPKYPLEKIFEAIKKHSPTFVCYRNKDYFDENEIIEFAKFTSNYSTPIINFDSLKNTGLLKYFKGIHFPSSKLHLINNFQNLITIASTHSKEEVKKAKNADFITFSPIFESKNRKGLGVEILNEIRLLHKNVIALGGIISDKEVKKIKNTKAIGFGSIRYFLT